MYNRHLELNMSKLVLSIFSPKSVLSLLSVNGNSIFFSSSGQKSGSHFYSSVFFFFTLPHLFYEQIFSKYIQNVTAFHQLYCSILVQATVICPFYYFIDLLSAFLGPTLVILHCLFPTQQPAIADHVTLLLRTSRSSLSIKA